MISRRLFRQLRIVALLFILLIVAGDAWLTKARTTDWDDPLWVVLYPVAGDDSDVTREYIRQLGSETFQPIEAFIAGEADRYGLPGEQLVKVRLGPVVHEIPPAPPEQHNFLSVGWWSLRLRFWVMRTAWRYSGPPANIRIFVKFHDMERHPRLAHSLGLQKGLVGVVNAYGSNAYAARNNVIIAHEVLHTLGASDKYEQAGSQPIYPGGYAEPDRRPLYPQRQAEIMGGRVPLSGTRSRMPASLQATVIGTQTAQEIRWLD